MTPTDILYKQFRNNPVFHSKKFLEYMHERFGMSLHHGLGSQGAVKLNDYLVYPVTQEIHNLAEAEKQKFFIDHLPEMFLFVCQYLRELEGE